MIVKLVQNAFFKAILPGFDRELQEGNVQVARRNQNATTAPAASEKPSAQKPAAQQQPNTARNTQGAETVTR